jgi:hypothetical protein
MHAEDAVVQTQPLMVWYAAEPTAELDMTRALASKLPQLFSCTVRRLASSTRRKPCGYLPIGWGIRTTWRSSSIPLTDLIVKKPLEKIDSRLSSD